MSLGMTTTKTLITTMDMPIGQKARKARKEAANPVVNPAENGEVVPRAQEKAQKDKKVRCQKEKAKLIQFRLTGILLHQTIQGGTTLMIGLTGQTKSGLITIKMDRTGLAMITSTILSQMLLGSLVELLVMKKHQIS